MKLLLGAVILASMPVAFSSQAQDKMTECQAIANVFQEAQGDFQITGELAPALALTDRVTTGMKKLNLKDAKLQNLQKRYITYLTSSNQLLKQALQSKNNDTALNAMMESAKLSSSAGHSLGKELIEYCIE